MRPDGQGGAAQRAEVRFDIAGCLRTPAGGSSRQTLLLAEPDGSLRARLLSAREAARLMGLPESYRLPDRYTDAYRLAGDGVAAPVARYLAEAIALPILASRDAAAEARRVISPENATTPFSRPVVKANRADVPGERRSATAP